MIYLATSTYPLPISLFHYLLLYYDFEDERQREGGEIVKIVRGGIELKEQGGEMVVALN